MTVAHLAAPGAGEQIQSFPGDVRQVREARHFVGDALAESPARERLLTCVSELAANAVQHTQSGAGGSFTVSVGQPRDGIAFVAVTDSGGPDVPIAGEADEFAEDGRGLALVAASSSRWGYCNTSSGRVVWAEATWPIRVRGAGGARRSPARTWHDTWTNLVRHPVVA